MLGKERRPGKTCVRERERQPAKRCGLDKEGGSAKSCVRGGRAS